MKNELEMIQTLFEYQSFGLFPFPIKPFSSDIHDSKEGRMKYHNASNGIQMSEQEIYNWFGEKKLDNCGLILGESGNLSILEFDNEKSLDELIKKLSQKKESNISDIIFQNFLENLFTSTTCIHTPENKIQFWFKYSKNLPTSQYKKESKYKTYNGINVYSDGFITAPPSFIRKDNYVGQFEISLGKEPINFPEEIVFFI
jgi:hypothetical protein